MGLQDKINERANSLPYGHQRKLEIARAMALDPKLLLLDEPLKGLDAETRQQAAAYILRHRNGAAGVRVTHDREDAAALGAEIVAL